VDPALVHPQATLGQLRLDSLALIELSLMVEERLGTTVTDVQGDTTPAELAALVGSGAAAHRVLAQWASSASEPAGAAAVPGPAGRRGMDRRRRCAQRGQALCTAGRCCAQRGRALCTREAAPDRPVRGMPTRATGAGEAEHGLRAPGRAPMASRSAPARCYW
jgi:hypothetical protein